MTEYNKLNHWYGWNGGECPVHPETKVEIRDACTNWKGEAGQYDWPSFKGGFMITKAIRDPYEVRFYKDKFGHWIHTQLDSGILFREVIDD